MLLLSLLLACTGGEPPPEVPARPATSVPEALVASTWQVRMADDAARAPFEGKDGWVATFETRPRDAVPAFAADPGACARIHTWYAAVYRQGALVAANATGQVWGATPEPTDPVEVAPLLLAASALADQDAWAPTVLHRLPAQEAYTTAWNEWSGEGGTWPPTKALAASPAAPKAPPACDGLPDAGPLPHWELPERTPEALTVKAADPAALYALADWHERAALAADPAHAALVAGWLDPWRLPPEPLGAEPLGEVPDAWLFMSPFSTAGDLALLTDLRRKGADAVAAHQADSPYAVAIARCTVQGRVDLDCVLDEGAGLATAMTTAMAAKAGGQGQSFHRPFTEYARFGLLLVADRVALAQGDTESAGRLRIGALDRAAGPARDALFLLSVAAWDAGNRNTARATQLVHELLPQVPGLEAAQLPLDALHVRVSRNAAPGVPMH